MLERHACLVLLLPLLATAAPLAGEPPGVLVCRGHEPEWNLRIDGSAATLATLDARGLTQTGLEGRLQETRGRVPSFVYRGRTGTPGEADLVAVITQEACVDTMAEATEGGGSTDYTARVSLPDGATRLGCCIIVPATPALERSPSPRPAVVPPPAEPPVVAPPVTPPPAAAPPITAPPVTAPPVVAPPVTAPPVAASPVTAPPVVAPPVTAPQLAASPVTAPPVVAPPVTAPQLAATSAAASGEITALALPDGRTCRRTGKGATTTFRGQRVNFDCGRRGGDTLGLVGPLTAGPEGILVAQKAVIEWREGGNAPPPLETTPARASEIALADGLTCRLAGMGATLAFEGRRASYTCGMKDGDTVALLGDLEPAERGFRITRARVAHDGSGFALRSTETILVATPR